jgi:hypothetical protein
VRLKGWEGGGGECSVGVAATGLSVNVDQVLHEEPGK